MTQVARNNGIVLYELGIDRSQIEEAQRILELVPQLMDILTSPVIPLKKKHRIIDRIFTKGESPTQLIHFFKIICVHNGMAEIDDSFQYYYERWDEAHHRKQVRCIFAKEPSDSDLNRIREFLQTRYRGFQFIFQIQVDPSILGGVIVQLGHEEYDWSFEGKIRQLEKAIKG